MTMWLTPFIWEMRPRHWLVGPRSFKGTVFLIASATGYPLLRRHIPKNGALNALIANTLLRAMLPISDSYTGVS
jgi:hypothetical protein